MKGWGDTLSDILFQVLRKRSYKIESHCILRDNRMGRVFISD